jgi:hypothetical protein
MMEITDTDFEMIGIAVRQAMHKAHRKQRTEQKLGIIRKIYAPTVSDEAWGSFVAACGDRKEPVTTMEIEERAAFWAVKRATDNSLCFQ